MKCPVCGQPSSVLESRSPLRRRECPQGHRFVTEEAVVRVLLNQEQRREEARRIARMPGTIQQVAAATGLSTSAVASYRRRHRRA